MAKLFTVTEVHPEAEELVLWTTAYTTANGARQAIREKVYAFCDNARKETDDEDEVEVRYWKGPGEKVLAFEEWVEARIDFNDWAEREYAITEITAIK